jgi:hypothetical protein
MDTGDRPCSGRPATAATTENEDKVDADVGDDRRITASELCAAVGIGKPAVMGIVRELGYRKVCAQRGCRKCSASNTKQPGKTSVQNFSSAVRKTEKLFCQE